MEKERASYEIMKFRASVHHARSILTNTKPKFKTIIVVLLYICLALMPFLLDNKPQEIRRHISRQIDNINIDHVDFELAYTINRRKAVFRSSEPILFEGSYVDLWLITYSEPMGTLVLYMRRSVNTVEPYSISMNVPPVTIE